MDWLWTDSSKNSDLKLSSAEHNLVRIKLAEQLCMSPDDLVIERPDDEELPARQLSSTGGERPFEGAFSWMVTAVREPQSIEEHNTQQAIARDLFTVSAVVFYRRKLSASTVQERRVLVDSIGAGLSGSEVELSFTSEEGIRPGQWIMLWANLPRLPGQELVENRGYFRWYQVVTASGDEDQLGKWFLSLRGPDWTDVLQRASLNNNIATYAIIVDSVVGVYEEVMQVETPSAWNGWQP